MNHLERKWDNRYKEKNSPGTPCYVLETFSHLLPPNGRSLDLACGLGANALLLSRLGLESHAWDLSSTALQKLRVFSSERELSVTTLQRNIESEPPEPESFDVIVVSQFLYRPICANLEQALRPGGLLFYQTFHNEKLSDRGPGSNNFLLSPTELLTLFSNLNVVYYREDGRNGNLQSGLRDMAYFIGKKPMMTLEGR